MKPFDSSNRIWNFIAALSLANACFLSVWRELIIVNAADSYWFPDYTSESYLAIMINVFAITLIAYRTRLNRLQDDTVVRRWCSGAI